MRSSKTFCSALLRSAHMLCLSLISSCNYCCVVDTIIKQQLSSLQYVRSVCNTREQQLSDGVANTDYVLPGVSNHSPSSYILLARILNHYLTFGASSPVLRRLYTF